MERALAISEATLGTEHPDVAIRRNNLGIVLRELGDLEGARVGYKRALVIGEAALGPDHPEVATYRSNLNGVLQVLREAPPKGPRRLASVIPALWPRRGRPRSASEASYEP